MSGLGFLKVNSVIVKFYSAIVKFNSGNLKQTFTVVRFLTFRFFRISSHGIEVSLYLIASEFHHSVAPLAA